MSKANLQAFYNVFRTDLELQNQLDGITDPAEYATKTVSLGASQGLEFTEAEVEAALAEPTLFLEETLGEELNDSELLIVVAGGQPKINTDT
jgi:predicted ribosomally synthesized peptide with nif11-like leader